MKILLPVFLTVNLMLIPVGSRVWAQEVTDTSAIWRIETSDGNEFFGTLISSDDSVLVLNTKMLGTITIPLNYVSSSTRVKQEEIKKGEIWMKNPQAARYFYAPNGYGLEKGTGYYQNTWVLFNQMSFGISNNFSMGAGLVPLFLFGGTSTPVWITPKFSVPVVRERFNLGGGMLLGILLDENAPGFGIGYVVGTYGNHDNNLTAGIGYGFADKSWINMPLINLSGMMRIGKKGYLMSENYFISGNGENYYILSFGGRSVWPKVSLDFGLVIPIHVADVFIAIPWLGFAIPLGRMNRSLPR